MINHLKLHATFVRNTITYAGKKSYTFLSTSTSDNDKIFKK